MTNRRRGGKGKTAVSKKADSPEKQTRKLRSRRIKKSESPEQTEEAASDYSGDEAEDSHNKRLDGGDEDSRSNIDSSNFDSGKNNEEKSQAKEEESGGSDGSWKVKSENGGGGGIPKLKLCLTRPPEMSSPTSTSAEQNPSPRRRRRSGRGNSTPTKEDEPEESVVEEPSKRVTRNQKVKELQEAAELQQEEEEETNEDEVIANEGEVTVNEGVVVGSEAEVVANQNQNQNESESQELEEKVVDQTAEATYNEERETISAVESICNLEPVEESQQSVTESVQEEPPVQEEIQTIETVDEKSTEPPEQEVNEPVEDKTEAPVEQVIETPVEQIPVPPEEKQEIVEETKPAEVCENQVVVSEEKEEPMEVLEENKVVEPEKEVTPEERHSSSRDSSEERAKEAALRSRNKYKKKEGSEEGEVIESPGMERDEVFGTGGSQDKSKTSSPIASAASESDRKENLEEPTPAKSGGRKRRWGSSTSKTTKKPSVSISTDVLKEIIPEVKPLLLSEVQLSPNEEDEEGQLKDSEENLPVVAKKVEREKMVQSDESEKDYEEEAVESGMEEPSQTETKAAPPPKEKEFTTFTRKVSVMSSNERLQKSPSPPRHKPSNILYIVNLVRPFTIPQLKELLARTGTITEDGFWIDKIKSKCYVKYETEEEAKTTRHALHGVRWPVSNPKQLNVDFGTEAAMKAAVEGNEVTTKRPIPSLFDKQIELKTGEKNRERERDKEKSGDKREKDKKDRVKHREEEKRSEGEEDKDKKSRPAVEPLVRDRTVRRVTMPIREWDVGKNEDGFSPPPDGIEFSRHRDDRYERRVEYDRDKRDDYDDRRRRDKDRSRRSASGEPPRKSKKKSEEEAPAKLLDDLFRKTKATPCIYWLPLTPEQISVKEEMRRKHMAEHEKKVAELRKMQREQSKRGTDKRRRRTRSRSRSRSTKK